VCDPTSSVVADYGEGIEAQGLHDRGLIRGHGPFGVRRMILVSEGLGTVAVSPQIGGNHRKPLCQPRCHQVPHRVGLRIAVEEQDRGAITPAHQLNLGVRGLYSLPFKALEQTLPFRTVISRTVVPYSQSERSERLPIPWSEATLTRRRCGGPGTGRRGRSWSRRWLRRGPRSRCRYRGGRPSCPTRRT